MVKLAADLLGRGFQELILADVMTGRLMSRPGWDELMARVQPKDTIYVRGEPVGEPCGQDHEDLVERGQQGNLRLNVLTYIHTSV